MGTAGSWIPGPKLPSSHQGLMAETCHVGLFHTEIRSLCSYSRTGKYPFGKAYRLPCCRSSILDRGRCLRTPIYLAHLSVSSVSSKLLNLTYLVTDFDSEI